MTKVPSISPIRNFIGNTQTPSIDAYHADMPNAVINDVISAIRITARKSRNDVSSPEANPLFNDLPAGKLSKAKLSQRPPVAIMA
jgi:hypothetical protein